MLLGLIPQKGNLKRFKAFKDLSDFTNRLELTHPKSIWKALEEKKSLFKIS